MFSVDELEGRNVLVLGASRSGMAAARLLHSADARVFVSEKRPADQVPDAVDELERLGIVHETGGHQMRGFPTPDFVVASPGIPGNAPIIDQLRRLGRPLVSEIEVASWFYIGTLVAVTGSNGKTTVTLWINHILREAGLNSVACGNIGYPFSDMIREHPKASHAVVEVSSYQLETIHAFHPHVSVLTNITPDHLDRHRTMEGYASAKSRIWMNQTDVDWTVLPHADTVVATISLSIRPNKALVALDHVPNPGAGIEDGALYVTLRGKKERLIDLDELPVPGWHNVANALCAAMTCRLAQLDIEEIRHGLRSFPGVEHRLELVADDGRRWINDSKATNVDSLRVALTAVDSPIILIAGGRDKGSSYESLRSLIEKKVERLLLIGEGGPRLEDELGDLTVCEQVETLEKAVRRAKEIALAGATVLLSPGCASFDQFRDFEHRGREYKRLVQTIIDHSISEKRT